MDQCLGQLEVLKVELLMEVEAQMGTLCPLSCNNTLSWHLPSLSPTALATHRSQHCSQMDSWRLRQLEQELVQVLVLVPEQELVLALAWVVEEAGEEVEVME